MRFEHVLVTLLLSAKSGFFSTLCSVSADRLAYSFFKGYRRHIRRVYTSERVPFKNTASDIS